MRSLPEIRFRLRQELANLWLRVRPPECDSLVDSPLELLPNPEQVADVLRGTPFADDLARLANQIVEHRFPLFDEVLDTGPEIHWGKDYKSGIENSTPYFRSVRYLDASRVGDVKLIWELNRHQHLIVLAQAHLCTGRKEYLDELIRQLESWWAANPYHRGVNWTSALEVAIRLLSWIWVFHLVGERAPTSWRQRLLRELYRHGCHVERNLSIYHSPNTHLIGEAVVLHAAGVLFPSFPRAEKWRSIGGRLVLREMDRQVQRDGGHFEQSTYYHLYSLDFFLLHAIVSEPSGEYISKLCKMARFLDALCGDARSMPLLGDDDGGRVFHPYGERRHFCRATLATCAIALDLADIPYDRDNLFEQALWWLGPRVLQCSPRASREPQSQHFPDTGLLVLCSSQTQVIVDAGPLGSGTGGHSHADCLQVLVRHRGEEVLPDSGTYCYGVDPVWRDWFRGTAAHNTVRIDGRDQSPGIGLFRWGPRPSVRLNKWRHQDDRDYLDAVCQYSTFRHRRRVLFFPDRMLVVLDEVDGPAGGHLIEQFWHLGEPAVATGPGCWRCAAGVMLLVDRGGLPDLSVGGEHGWRSTTFGSRRCAPVVRVTLESELPAQMPAVLWLGDDRVPLELHWDALNRVLTVTGAGEPQQIPIPH